MSAPVISRKTVIFADQSVGLEAVRHVAENHPGHLQLVVTTSDNAISDVARRHGCATCTVDEVTETSAPRLLEGIDLIVLAWWPRLVPGFVVRAPRIGTVNFHPSLLPHNRGKHYNFWTLVESTPFGVSLHFVNDQIDAGDILFQAPIEKSWEDTGGTLYEKALRAMTALFKARYIDIIEERFQAAPQDLSKGTLHYARELEPASRIDLDASYRARDLLNLLRARTFDGKPACYFEDAGKRYEVRISISQTPHD